MALPANPKIVQYTTKKELEFRNDGHKLTRTTGKWPRRG